MTTTREEDIQLDEYARRLVTGERHNGVQKRILELMERHKKSIEEANKEEPPLRRGGTAAPLGGG
jgi:hypothetical protein